MISKKQIYLIGFITLFGFGLLGFLIIENFIHQSFLFVFWHGIKWYLQILIGGVFGFIAALTGWALIKSNLLKPVKNHYSELIKSLNLNKMDIIFLSLCAGMGEEIFFRGALQYFLGIWPTSFLFILLHGYINPLNWRLSIYGIVMTFFIVGLSFLYEFAGMITAITAHFTIDVFLLSVLSAQKPGKNDDLAFRDSIK